MWAEVLCKCFGLSSPKIKLTTILNMLRAALTSRCNTTALPNSSLHSKQVNRVWNLDLLVLWVSTSFSSLIVRFATIIDCSAFLTFFFASIFIDVCCSASRLARRLSFEGDGVTGTSSGFARRRLFRPSRLALLFLGRQLSSDLSWAGRIALDAV